MPGVIFTVPPEIWAAFQKEFGVKRPVSQLRLIVSQYMWDELKLRYKWANGSGAAPPAAAVSHLDDAALDAEIEELMKAKAPFTVKPPPPVVFTRPEPEPVPEIRQYWRSPHALKPDMLRAWVVWRRSAELFWVALYFPPDKAPQKSLDSLIDFLERNEGKEYDELTPGEQGWVGLICQVHANWYKATHK